MGECLVSFCNNSAAKGYRMIRFPTNFILQTAWVQNIPSTNCKLDDNSRICEVHFAPEAWHVNICRRKKLKSDAIPTIFGYYLTNPHIENNNNKKNKKIKITESRPCEVYFASETTDAHHKHKICNEVPDNVITEQVNVSTVDISKPSTSSSSTLSSRPREVYFSSEKTDAHHKHKICNEVPDNVITEQINVSTVDISKPSTSSSVALNSRPCEVYFASETMEKHNKCNKEHQRLISEYKRCEEIRKKQYQSIFNMRRQIKILRNTIIQLQSKNDNDKYYKALRRIFNEDQINSLLNKTRVQNWSNATIVRVLKLKDACGTNGYKELLNQGIPLPSIRTLSRKLENLEKLDIPDIPTWNSDEITEFLKSKKSSFCKETDMECELIFDGMTITPTL